LTIADPQNWAALAAFLITGVTVGHRSELAKRRAAQAEAVRTSARLATAKSRSLLEASPDALATIGTDGKIDDVNSAIETLTGHSRASLIGTDFSACFTEPERARSLYREVLREGFVHDRPLEIRHRDGHVTSVLYNGSLHRDEEGRIIGVVAAARSISASAARLDTMAPDRACESPCDRRGAGWPGRVDVRHRLAEERLSGAHDHQTECGNRPHAVRLLAVAPTG
jgi:PAS domain S-box-containing protein